MSKYGVISGPYFPAFGKYEPEITPYLDTFHAVQEARFLDLDIKVRDEKRQVGLFGIIDSFPFSIVKMTGKSSNV